jgi:N-acyl-D-amino-acid deacylase
MAYLDILIKKGYIIDGSGLEPIIGSIGISGDRIALVSHDPEESAPAETVIDAEGFVVSPGFIDTHSHSEFTLLADSRAEGKVLQGITTEINGNCGLSAAPLIGDAMIQREGDLRELGIEERWSNLKEYFLILEKRGLTMNFATLVGHGNLRASVIGYRDKRPLRHDIQDMLNLLDESIRDGAIGLSTGLIYPPGVYSDREEIIELASSIKDLIYTTHMRSEGDMIEEAVEETIDVGRRSGIHVHISHIKTSGKKNWTKIDRIIDMIEKARNDGVEITADRYPYVAASTDLDAILPAWAYEGGVEKELERLRDQQMREVMRAEILSQHPENEYWSNIMVSSVANEDKIWMEGKSIEELSIMLKKNPVDLLFDILLEERLRVGAIFFSMTEENLSRFLSLPYVMIGSDSSARSFNGKTKVGKPHPRGFGSFPRFLHRYADTLGLSDAIHKITALPAMTFSLHGRGRISEGYYADIVIFDREKIKDRATFEEPFMKPEGIHYVIINGKITVEKGLLTGARNGRILRGGI